MKIVFWNINKKSIGPALTLLAEEIRPDILFLAEAQMGPVGILNALNSKKTTYFFNPDPICEKVLMFSKYRDEYVKPATSNLRYTVRTVSVPNYPEFNLMSLHYQSKRNWKTEGQAAHTMELNLAIREFENNTKSKMTLLIGDFNMNPFELGMVQTTGFHSVMSKDIALKGGRSVDGKEYPYFYNPMWSFYGDHGKGDVNGTLYSQLSEPINYFWNIFDQVLIRPDLIPYVNEEAIEIITQLGESYNLLKKNNLINTSISDHLPISVILKNN